jgi:hypothetical protein
MRINNYKINEFMTEEISTEATNGVNAPRKSKGVKKKKVAKKVANKKVSSKASKITRNYPPITLEKSLVLPQKIKVLNGGNSWDPNELRKACNIGDTTKFFYYTASSRDFGLTTGTSSAKEVSLTDFGRSVVYAPNAETEHKLKLEAFLNIDIFRNVLEYYKGNNLPEMKYLGNTLEDKFKLSPEFHEEFSQIFRDNCEYLNITQGMQLDKVALQTIQASDDTAASTIIVGETKKGLKTGLKAFVIMPFTERNGIRSEGFFKEVLNSLLIPAGIEAGFNIETANKQGSDVIHSTIINDLLEADIVIADLTDHNPNVLFELGMRMHADLPVALIKTKDTGRIFDVDNMLRVYEYNQNLWKSTIEKDVAALVEHFKAVWSNKGSEQTYMKILRRGVSK